MSAHTHNAWRRVALSMALACLFGILVYVALTGLSPVAANDPANRRNREPPPTLLDDTGTYTTFLPIVLNCWCPDQPVRRLFQGQADFAGGIEILDPPGCTTGLAAETSISVAGTYTGTPANVSLWVLVYAPDHLYYAQSPNACEGEPPFQQDGVWQVPVYLGEKGGSPEWFHIVAILADQEASQFLSDWLQQGCQSGEYTGIPVGQLEQRNITEKDYIIVQTAD